MNLKQATEMFSNLDHFNQPFNFFLSIPENVSVKWKNSLAN